MIPLFLCNIFSSMQEEVTLPQKPQFYNTDGLIAVGNFMPFFRVCTIWLHYSKGGEEQVEMSK